MPPRKPSVVGAHVFTAGGLATGGLGYARQIGADAVQVFLSNPRGWAASPGDPAEDTRFRDGCRTARTPVFVHAPYLVNLGSPTPVTQEKSVAALLHSLARGRAVGAAGVVFHAGSAVDGSRRDTAMKRVRELLLPLLDTMDDAGPRLLVEPTAGGGEALAATVEETAAYLGALDSHPALGVCLDTCHLFAAGHDLATPGGMRTTLTAAQKALGRERLALVHANDSKDGCGSRRDRHESLGKGKIGAEPFAELFRHPVTRGVPVIVETPGKVDDHSRDVALLKELRDR